MCAGRVAYCPLVSHVEYTPCALLGLEKKTGQMDERTSDRYITLTSRRGKRNDRFVLAYTDNCVHC